MKRANRICVVGLVSLWGVIPICAQGPGGGQAGSVSNPASRTTNPRTAKRALDLQNPVYISGRVVLETGKPVQESLGVVLACESKPLQAIHTDLGGYFTFTLGGGGGEGNMDFSASNEGPLAMGRNLGDLPRNLNSSLRGCEVRLSVPGYYPMSYPLLESSAAGRIEVGTLQLRRVASVPGSYVSLTSLLVPDNARKEFEKALKDQAKHRSDSAQQHLEKAVSLYAEYAAAWNELGQVYQDSGKSEEARQAYEKAITADSHYIQPYLNLAFLQLQSKQWQDAVETGGLILELDSSIGVANFIQAVGNFNLHQLDAAEKSAQEAERRPHESIPQLHVLLAEILLQKQDYENAATQMRTYLEEDPAGPFAERVKKELEDIKVSAGNAPEKLPRAPVAATP